MKQTLLFFTIVMLVSCAGPKQPEFIKLTDLNVSSASLDEITLEANAIYHNPNKIGAQVLATDIDVSANGIPVGKVNQVSKIKAAANQEFALPLKISFPPKKILKDGGLLGSVLMALGGQKVKLEYEGEVQIAIAKIKMKVPISVQDSIALKK